MSMRAEAPLQADRSIHLAAISIITRKRKQHSHDVTHT